MTDKAIHSDPGFGIYIHWPFCAAKCPYCDFNSHVRHAAIDQRRFAKAFARELATMRQRTGARSVTSIFLGGGTPSLMEPGTVGAILEAVAANWHVPSNVEITLEANPSSADAGRFAGYRAAGVNRCSLGVQALNDRDLKFLGRLHNVEEALNAVALARRNFPLLSFDLIYARPDQGAQDWRRELETAIGHAADHLSLYQLTIEEGTPFHSLYTAGKIQTPSPEDAVELYEVTQEVTEKNGLPSYEISNHARPGFECRHNLVYWRYGQYVGVGPGAHGRFEESNRRIVTIAERSPEKWLETVEKHGYGTEKTEILTADQQADELLLMGLRLVEGIDLSRYEKLAGRGFNPKRLARLQSEGLVEARGNSRLCATPRGRVVLEWIIAELSVPYENSISFPVRMPVAQD